jgi:DNA invertase Pin-like site-specific DNA recombinase
VLVLRFDRFARSTKHLVLALEEFSSLGMDFISLNESIDTSSPMGRMVFTVIAAVAELERSIIQERVQAGVDRARKQGKTFGRPRAVFDRERARVMAQTMSVRAIAKRLGVSKSLIARALHK